MFIAGNIQKGTKEQKKFSMINWDYKLVCCSQINK
jgi:hypothetical protein